MIYKALLAQKVIAKLLQEFFLVVCCKVIAPGKHAFLHFYTLSALCYKNAQKKSAFWTLYLRLFNGGETRIRTGDKGFAGLFGQYISPAKYGCFTLRYCIFIA